MRNYFHLWLSALFLKREAYEYQRDRRDSFAHGLAFVGLIGVIVALFGIAGAALRYATEPNADAIKNTVLNHLQAMPFYSQVTSQGEGQFLSGYNRVWETFGSIFVGHPTKPGDLVPLFASLVTTPLLWVIGWLLYGAVAHLVASRGNPHSSLAHGLGTLALATSPQLLSAVTVLPGASISGAVLGLWTMILNVFALRTAYRVSTQRAVFSALLPLLLLLLILILFACVGIFALSTAARGGQR
jgi:hypothetical protein